MKSKISKIALTLSVFWFVGCGSDLHQPTNEIVQGSEVVVDLDGNSIKTSLIEAGMPGVDESTTVYGYKAYKIPYTTTDEQGNSVKVSGLMVIPTEVPEAMKQAGFSVVSDDHDTIMANADAPTVVASTISAPAGASVILTSLYAFVTLQADYIGFGDSVDHYHPFLMKKSAANATVDFINAARKFAQANDIPLNGQLFVTGYSEGGYDALATLEKIEQDGELQVTLAAPMAGPYDMNRTAMGELSKDYLPIPSYVAFVAYAYTKTYDKDMASVFNEPYASDVETLFDGSLARPEIDPQLPNATDGLMNPDFRYDFLTNPDNWLRKATLENNVNEWGPQTPVRLVHCMGDNVVPFPMAQLAEATMNAYGAADVSIVPVEVAVTGDSATPLRYNHFECGPVAYGVAAHMFAEARHATIGY
ncbi:lipase family protein [Sulfurovum sp.]|uniref:lipase family protein n=1 Tax=Sulfurovum sp. TaxID=1969726 RepID=UPI0025EB1451|nr:lipase family protein [Sulfurovum sp.]